MTKNEKLSEMKRTAEEMFLDPEDLGNYDPEEVKSVFEVI